MSPLLLPIVLPLFMALLACAMPNAWVRVKRIWLMAGALAFTATVYLAGRNLSMTLLWNGEILLSIHAVNRLALYAAGFMAPLIVWISMAEAGAVRRSWLMLSALSMGAMVLLADHLILLVLGWGGLGLLLYLMIPENNTIAAAAAQKTLFMVGGTDALLVFGIAYLALQQDQVQLSGFVLTLKTAWQWLAFGAVLIAILAKVGAMPFHTWLPAMAEQSDGSVNALVPATLDKLVGIYLLTRLVQSMPVMPPLLRIFLLLLGVLSLLGGVLMALMQHDMRRLLAYHAVSQTGYMLLGIATGSILGLAAAFFHLINNVLYKSGLFMAAGAVEHAAGHTQLDRLGGLSTIQPRCFAAFMVMALAISGIPPLNGFVSKWLIIQSLADQVGQNNRLAVFAMIAALAGSGLTLASFMKLSYSVYLGPVDEALQRSLNRNQVGWQWLPLTGIALSCLLLGVAGLKWVMPALIPPGESYTLRGLWAPGQAALLLLLGIFTGTLIFLMTRSLKPRIVPRFSGGEMANTSERVLGSGFYLDVEALPLLRTGYQWASQQLFDFYEQGRKYYSRLALPFRQWHNGHLNRYVGWLILGWVVLTAVIMGARS